MNQISPLAFVHPEAKLGDNNIIGPFCYIDRNTVIGDNNVMQNSVTIHAGARLGNNNEIFPGASIATKPQDLKYRGEETLCEVGDNNSIRENVTISRGTASKGTTIVGNNNLLMENMHVAHDCVLGNNIIVGNSTKFAGEVEVDDNAIISAVVLCHQFCKIGGYVMIQGGCRFSQDIPPYVIAGKEPTRYCGLNLDIHAVKFLDVGSLIDAVIKRNLVTESHQHPLLFLVGNLRHRTLAHIIYLAGLHGLLAKMFRCLVRAHLTARHIDDQYHSAHIFHRLSQHVDRWLNKIAKIHQLLLQGLWTSSARFDRRYDRPIQELHDTGH